MNNKVSASEIALTELAGSFGLFDDWEDRYRYLIDLGKRIPPMEEGLKTDQTLVRGCTSKVWMVMEWQDGHLQFQADSDAQIIKGLIYILNLAYQNKTRAEIEVMDINKTFEDLGLDRHLSPNRRNGFFSMVERIKSFA
jgi:cysteine desulfuration protein SufE